MEENKMFCCSVWYVVRVVCFVCERVVDVRGCQVEDSTCYRFFVTASLSRQFWLHGLKVISLDQDLHCQGAGDGCINQVSLTDTAAWLSCVKVSGGEFVLYYLPWPASRSFHYIHYAIHIWIIMRRSLAARNLKSFLENDCILWQHNGSHIKN